MVYEINDKVKQNLLGFLNRVQLQGFNELSAMNELLSILNNPVNTNLDSITKEE